MFFARTKFVVTLLLFSFLLLGTAQFALASTDGAITAMGDTQINENMLSSNRDKAVRLKTFKLNATRITVAPRDTYQFKLTITPAIIGIETVNWLLKSEIPGATIHSSFDPITRVFTAGNVEGEMLKLTAVAPNGAVSTCNISVKSTQIKAMSFKGSVASVSVGSKIKLAGKLVISPSNAADKTVTWSSNNVNVATVDADGVVTVHNEGTAKITATSNGNSSLSPKYTIKGVVVRVKKFSVNTDGFLMNIGDVGLIEAEVLPATASYKNVIWVSDNSGVATVTQKGLVTAVGSGVATITGTTDNGKKTVLVKARVRGGDMKTVKLSAVGDVILGGDSKKVPKADDPIKDGLTSLKRFKKFLNLYGSDYFFKGVKGVFEGDDVTVVNFEGTLTNYKYKNVKTYNFAGEPSYANILKDASVEVACLANNHSLDYRTQGYNDTVKHLKAVGVTPYGFNSKSTNTFTTASGIKFGFAGYKMPAPKSDIAAAIKKLKKSSDIVVVSFHWTGSTEWTNKVTSTERSMARYAINQGADLVIGHHKHVVSGIERYKGKMIAYDVGNFITLIRNRIGKKYLDKSSMIYQQRFNLFSDGYVEVLDPNIIPVMNSDSQEVLTGNPHLLSGEEAQGVLDKIKKYSLEKDRNLARNVPTY